MPLEPASGSAGDERTPRDARGRDDVHECARLSSLGAYTESDALRTVDPGDVGQEAILDLIVAATLARDDPLDDELADADYWDPDDLRDLRNDEATPSDTAVDEGVSPGWGFASKGILDGQVPGPVLAELTDRAHGGGLHLVNDDELTGVIRAWRRLTSWATARELAAVAELARRRPAEESSFGLEIKARLRAAGSGDSAGSTRGDSGRGSSSGDKASAAPGSAPGPDAGFPGLISPFASDELAAALTLTTRAAETHLEFATELACKLPKTAAALEAGVIDPVRARIIADATRMLTNEQAAAVEDLILPKAGQQTSGQLWAALARAILAADPDAARRRREEAQRDARVMRWREEAGTAALCGRDLPSVEVLAADQRISARARELKSAGMTGTMDELRARAYLDFLLGRSTVPAQGAGPGQDMDLGRRSGPEGGVRDRQTTSPAPGGSAPSGNAPAGPGAAPARADGGTTDSSATAGACSSLAARINVTVPLSVILGLSDAPAEVSGFGPVDGQLARELVRVAGIRPATRWCVTAVGHDGQAVGHGCARGRHTAPGPPPATPGPPPPATPGPPPPAGNQDHLGRPRTRDGPGGSTSVPEPKPQPQEPVAYALHVEAKEFMQRLGVKLTSLAVGACDHRNEEPGYKPSRRLRHLTSARTDRCTAPGCRRPAAQCDFDHTVAYEAGGRTCECNLSPLCRRHHRCKQAQGWALEQTSPGNMAWKTPSGRRYTTTPTSYDV
jgi:Domain of unknown function (DUF222)